MLDNVPLRYIMYLKETRRLKTHFFELTWRLQDFNQRIDGCYLACNRPFLSSTQQEEHFTVAKETQEDLPEPFNVLPVVV